MRRRSAGDACTDASLAASVGVLCGFESCVGDGQAFCKPMSEVPDMGHPVLWCEILSHPGWGWMEDWVGSRGICSMGAEGAVRSGGCWVGG